MIQIITKIKKVGGSYHVIISNTLFDSLKIDIIDFVKVNIEKYVDENMTEYECRACNHRFCLEEETDEKICPACDNESLIVVSKSGEVA